MKCAKSNNRKSGINSFAEALYDAARKRTDKVLKTFFKDERFKQVVVAYFLGENSMRDVDRDVLLRPVPINWGGMNSQRIMKEELITWATKCEFRTLYPEPTEDDLFNFLGVRLHQELIGLNAAPRYI